MNRHAFRSAVAAMALVLLAALAACVDREPPAGTTVQIGVMGHRVPVMRSEFTSTPDSAFLPGDAGSLDVGSGRGVAVEVRARLNGFRGLQVPFSYGLYHAGSGLPLVTQTTQIVPSSQEWARRGWVWLAIPGPGTYYAQVTLNDTTGRATEGPRTPDFTVD